MSFPVFVGVFLLVVFFILFAIVLVVYKTGEIAVEEIKEGTALALERLGSCVYVAMAFNRHDFDDDGFIVDDEDARGVKSYGKSIFVLRLFGWVFYLPRFVKPTVYTEHNKDDGFGKDKRVFLNKFQVDFKLSKAESRKKETIPLDLAGVFDLHVVQIEFFLFEAPWDVIDRAKKVIEAMVRAWARAHTADYIQDSQSDGTTLWSEITRSASSRFNIAKLRSWGLKVVPNSITITDVGMQPEDQAAFKEAKNQEQKARGSGQELVGGLLANYAVAHGYTDAKAAQKELKKTAAGRRKLDEICAKADELWAKRKLGDSYIRVDGDPITGLVGRMLTGGRRR